MKIRIYFPFFPFPVTEGAYLVVADQIRHFSAEGYEVELVCWRESAISIERKLAGSGWPAAAKWICLDAGPETTAERFFRVVRSLFSRFASPELFFYPPKLIEQTHRLGCADLAIYHYSYAYAWLSERGRLPTESRRVVHLHNIESAVHELRSGPLGWVHRRNVRKLRVHEAALAQVADELWFLSPLDAEMLRAPSARVAPPTIDPALRNRRRGSAAGQIIVGFIGAMDFKPNYESARWILEEVAPRLERAGFAGKLVFAGRAMPTDLRDLGAKHAMVEFRGFVEDLDAFWSELSFLAAPHLVGSGVRTKILESVASGVPVLTNTGGAAALVPSVRDSAWVIRRDDPDAWVRVLMEEAGPQATRRKLEAEPTCAGLSAEEVYRPLREEGGCGRPGVERVSRRCAG
jgi:glycosyltransferase involved in cell wall biosynthesis